MNLLPCRPLGNTGILTSAIGLGTVKFGRNQGVKYPNGFDLPTDAQICNLLSTAQELGINTLDTAPAYGLSEARLGTLLSNRQKWVIVDKAGESFQDGQSHFDFSAQGLRDSLEHSLRTLNTDYIDVLLLHSNGCDLELIEQGCLETLRQFKQEGKIRCFGMSSKTAEGALAALAYSDVLMLTYHPGHTAERPALDYAQKHHKGCLIKKVLASGHIDNASTAAEHLRFAYAHPAASSLIIGTLNPEHLRQNANALL